jgi:hypothetical protein
VELPRSRIAPIMLVVAVTALDLGALRAVLDFESPPLFLRCVVLLPMANILAVGLLLAFLRPRSRQFLLGFEVFGAMALALVIVATIRYERLVQSFLGPPMALYEATIGPPPPVGENWPSYRVLVGFCLLSLWATWPQLAFALVGGFLFRRCGAAERPDRTHR